MPPLTLPLLGLKGTYHSEAPGLEGSRYHVLRPSWPAAQQQGRGGYGHT